MEWLGLRTVDAHTVEIDLADELRNPWGILHGGVVASIIDLAAEHTTGGTMTDVTLHFLAPNRPGRSTRLARPLGGAPTAPSAGSRSATRAPTASTALAVVTARASMTSSESEFLASYDPSQY